MPLCSVDGCGRERFCKGYCSKHYQQVRAHGHVTEGWKTPLAGPEDRVCDIQDCGRAHKGLGLCGMHLNRMRKTGSTDEPDQRVYETLDVDVVRERCVRAGYTYVSGYVGYSELFLGIHNRCGDVVQLSQESVRKNRIAEGCSCRIINRTHRLYELGYYLIDTWSDEEDDYRRYDLVNHLACGRDFIVMETSLVSDHVSGPHPCNPRWVDPDEAQERYYAAGGIPHGPYPGNSDVPWIGSCARCGEKVSPVWESIQAGQGVCLKCGFESSRAKNKTPNHVILRILESHRVVLAPGFPIPAISSANPNGCCVECGDPVRTKPINLAAGIRSSCSCTPSNHGFDSGAEADGYLIEKQIRGATVRKYGICNTSSSRLSKHQRNEWFILNVSPPNAGHVIRDMERDIHQNLGKLGVRQTGIKGKFDGYTETYRPDLVDFEAETFEELHAKSRAAI